MSSEDLATLLSIKNGKNLFYTWQKLLLAIKLKWPNFVAVLCHCNRELKPFYMFTLLCTPLVYFSCIRKENKGVLIKMWATAFRYHWTCLSEVAEVQSGLMTLEVANLLSRCFVVLSTYKEREATFKHVCTPGQEFHLAATTAIALYTLYMALISFWILVLSSAYLPSPKVHLTWTYVQKYSVINI